MLESAKKATELQQNCRLRVVLHSSVLLLVYLCGFHTPFDIVRGLCGQGSWGAATRAMIITCARKAPKRCTRMQVFTGLLSSYRA